MKQCFSTLGCVERPLADILLLAQTYHIPYLEFRGIGGVIDNREIADFAQNRLGATRTCLAPPHRSTIRTTGLPPLRKRTPP